jgi:hypothetical protein
MLQLSRAAAGVPVLGPVLGHAGMDRWLPGLCGVFACLAASFFAPLLGHFLRILPFT